jgi:type III pantothenate kinase
MKGANMLFAVDIGNTQTVLGLYQGQELISHWRVATLVTDTADQLCIRVRDLLALDDRQLCDIEAVALCSVVPTLTEQWCQAATKLGAKEVLNLSAETDSGLTFGYGNPAEVGADRIADAVAAIALYGAPVIIADFGTATNIEVVNREGVFIGGIIAPGLQTSADALFAAAARLSRISLEVPKTVIGTNTADAVRSGLTYGEIDRIDGLVKRVFAELGYPATVVATGGLSARVSELSTTINYVNDDLTLEGLRLIWQRTHD